jgi:WD40 repeat protein
LSTCPANDTFLSSSDDGFVRLWNIQQAGCLAQLELPKDATAGSPLACFDATGLVFCATAQMSDKKGQYVHLYDARNYAAGAFAEFKLNQGDFEAVIQTQLGLDAHRAGVLSQSAFRSVTFNVSGEQILVGAENGLALVIDGFDGTIKRAFMESSKTSVQPAVVAFTPDDKTVLFGNENGSVTCYDVTNGAVIKTLESHNARVNCIAANPKYTQIASSCTQTALWMW